MPTASTRVGTFWQSFGRPLSHMPCDTPTAAGTGNDTQLLCLSSVSRLPCADVKDQEPVPGDNWCSECVFPPRVQGRKGVDVSVGYQSCRSGPAPSPHPQHRGPPCSSPIPAPALQGLTLYKSTSLG